MTTSNNNNNHPTTSDSTTTTTTTSSGSSSSTTTTTTTTTTTKPAGLGDWGWLGLGLGLGLGWGAGVCGGGAGAGPGAGAGAAQLKPIDFFEFLCSAAAQTVLGWCSNCARLVLKLCSAGAHIVLGWCSNCARLVLKLCSAGAQIVLGWCSNCARLVLKLCFSCGPSGARFGRPLDLSLPGLLFSVFSQLFLRSPYSLLRWHWNSKELFFATQANWQYAQQGPDAARSWSDKSQYSSMLQRKSKRSRHRDRGIALGYLDELVGCYVVTWVTTYNYVG